MLYLDPLGLKGAGINLSKDGLLKESDFYANQSENKLEFMIQA